MKKIIKKISLEFDFKFRKFIYKSIIISFLIIIVFKVTFGAVIFKIDNILNKIEEIVDRSNNLLSMNSDGSIKKDVRNFLKNRIESEEFINPDDRKILQQLYKRIANEYKIIIDSNEINE
tara:strand:+ start:149 stop:508 length:360 start_codon:yes stop_codon:yes gene_type:complete